MQPNNDREDPFAKKRIIVTNAIARILYLKHYHYMKTLYIIITRKVYIQNNRTIFPSFSAFQLLEKKKAYRQKMPLNYGRKPNLSPYAFICISQALNLLFGVK